jgi:hypothetical protein
MIEWMNENENRNYPIKEDLPAISVTGDKLPSGILADMAITIEGSRTDEVFISSVTLTPTLVSVAVGDGDSLLLLASITNVETHKVYRLEPQAANVSGFVAFGYRAIVESPEAYEFEGVAQTGLSSKAIRAMEVPPVTSLGKAGSAVEPLTGDIRLIAGSKIYIKRSGDTIQIGLQERYRHQFVGPCDRLAEFITCGRPPIRTINGVGPDGSGKITIEVE